MTAVSTAVKRGQLPGVDVMKLLLAAAVVFNHCNWELSHAAADIFFVQAIVRQAIPFYTTCTAYMLFRGRVELAPEEAARYMRRGIGRLLWLYFVWSGGYLVMMAPSVVRAVGLRGLALFVVRKLLLEGAVETLWYFPATVVALVVYSWLRGRLSWRGVFALSVVLYLLGYASSLYMGRSPGLALSHVLGAMPVRGLLFLPLFVAVAEHLAAQRGATGNSGRWGLAALGLLGLTFVEMWGVVQLIGPFTRFPDIWLSIAAGGVCWFRFALGWQLPELPLFLTMRKLSVLLYLLHPGISLVLVKLSFVWPPLMATVAARYLAVMAATLFTAGGIVWLAGCKRLRFLRRLY